MRNVYYGIILILCIGIFSIPQTDLTITTESELIMVQQKNWISTGVTINGVLGQNSIVKIGSYYYVAYYVDNTTSWVANIDRFDLDWTNQTNVYTVTKVITTTDYYLAKPCLVYVYDDFGLGIAEHYAAIYCITKKAANYDSTILRYRYDVTHSAVDTDSDTTTANLDVREVALNPPSTQQWQKGPNASTGANSLFILASTETLTGECSKSYTSGTTTARYLLYNGGNILVRQRVTGPTFSTVETLASGIGSDLTMDNGQYWEYGDVRIAGWTDHFYIDYGDNVWHSLSTVNGSYGSYPIAHWSIDDSNITYVKARLS